MTLPHFYDQETLKKNLTVISVINPDLFKRICWPANDTHIRFLENDSVLYVRQAMKRDIRVIPEHLHTLKTQCATGKVLCFGVGLGEIPVSFLEDNRSVILYERDPWLLRLFLMRYDITEHLKNGTITIWLGIDIYNKKEAEYEAVAAHPSFRDLYSNELRLMQEPFDGDNILLCAGTLFTEDISKHFRTKQYNIFTLDHNVLSLEEIRNILSVFNPRFIFAINYINHFAEFCENEGVPFLCWEIDPSIQKLEKVKSDTGKSQIFTYRRKNLALYKNAGFRHVHYLPLATNPEKRKPDSDDQETSKYSCGISFVGASMAEQARDLLRTLNSVYSALRKTEPPDAEFLEVIQKIMKEQKSDWNVFRIPELIEKYIPGFLDEAANTPSFPFDPVMLLAETAASEKRFSYLSALGETGIHLWGDPAWSALEESGCRYMGEAGHRKEISKIYSQSRINLDINRIYQMDIVTMRVFDAMACGGFVLTEHSAAIEEIFRIGQEIDTYKNVDDLSDKVTYYLKNPDKAREIARTGRERVLKDHTIGKRMDKIILNSFK